MDNSDPNILYRVELKPHRSARPGAGFVVLLVLGFFWSVIGAGAAYFGAWPLSAFYGAEFMLILIIIWMFVKAGDQREYITLTNGLLHVRSSARYGVEKSFNPYWVQVVSKSEDRRSGRIEISSHGESVVVGTHLSANECDAIARELNQVLSGIKEGAGIEKKTAFRA